MSGCRSKLPLDTVNTRVGNSRLSCNALSALGMRRRRACHRRGRHTRVRAILARRTRGETRNTGERSTRAELARAQTHDIGIHTLATFYARSCSLIGNKASNLTIATHRVAHTGAVFATSTVVARARTRRRTHFPRFAWRACNDYTTGTPRAYRTRRTHGVPCPKRILSHTALRADIRRGSDFTSYALSALGMRRRRACHRRGRHTRVRAILARRTRGETRNTGERSTRAELARAQTHDIGIHTLATFYARSCSLIGNKASNLTIATHRVAHTGAVFATSTVVARARTRHAVPSALSTGWTIAECVRSSAAVRSSCWAFAAFGCTDGSKLTHRALLAGCRCPTQELPRKTWLTPSVVRRVY